MVFQTVQIFNESEGYFNHLDCLKWKNAFFEQTVTLRIIIGRFFIMNSVWSFEKVSVFCLCEAMGGEKSGKNTEETPLAGIYTQNGLFLV